MAMARRALGRCLRALLCPTPPPRPLLPPYSAVAFSRTESSKLPFLSHAREFASVRRLLCSVYFSQRRGLTSGEQGKSAEDGIGENNDKITVTFVDKDGEEKTIQVPLGMSMLEAAHENDIELEGACEGSLACSTCHVIVMDIETYNKLPEPTDEENDMLDLAFGLTETSRLGCQVIARPELDGMKLALPAATRNFAVDGYVPKPH